MSFPGSGTAIQLLIRVAAFACVLWWLPLHVSFGNSILAADHGNYVASGRSNGRDGPYPARPDDAPPAEYGGVGKRLLQDLGDVQRTAGDVQTLEDQANADGADTLIDDAFDVGSGRSNGADGPGKPDGGAAPSGTNAGAVNPPPGSLGRRSRSTRSLVFTQANAIKSGAKSSKQEADFKSSRDLSKVLLCGQWLEDLRERWLSFAEQASSPTSMLSGAATATAAVMLAFRFQSSFPDKIAKIMASRPNDVSVEVWLLALALSRLLPATVYVGMTWRVLHMMKNGTRQSDQAVAVIAALCVKNAATIEKFMTLLDGLDTHPSIDETSTDSSSEASQHSGANKSQHSGANKSSSPCPATAAPSWHAHQHFTSCWGCKRLRWNSNIGSTAG
ncbi:hypothetical protein WJX77_006189 [Trebouxia sp. C0004]